MAKQVFHKVEVLELLKVAPLPDVIWSRVSFANLSEVSFVGA